MFSANNHNVTTIQESEQRKRPIVSYLRIAFSAECGIVSLLLIMLWARSYRTYDELIGEIGCTRLVAIDSMSGAFGFGTAVWPSLPPPYADYVPWRVTSYAIEEEGQSWLVSADYAEEVWLFRYEPQPNQEWKVRMPYWFAIVLFVAASAAPWFRWSRRFSRRTLLILTTLIGVGLGVFVISK